MTNALGAKPAVDTSEFKARLREMNADLRVLESGFRASTASMGDWAATGTGLEARIRSLNSQMDVQRGKVSLLKGEYERIKAEKGADATATKNAEVQYNKAAETLGKMQNELNQTEAALVEVRADTDSAGREFQDLENKTEKAGNAVKGTGSKLLDFSIIMTGVNSVVQLGRQAFYMLQAAVRGVANIVSSLVGPASDLNETISKTQVVFGDAAGEVLTFGKNAAGALGLSENAALAAAGTYGNLFRAFGTTEEASADMSMALVQLAADLASFNNMEVEEVFDKLRAGLTGESEPLKTLGIAMNQARLQAKALELGLIEEGEALDANAKAQAAYAIMMEDTALAQGDFERTSEGLANQQRILAAEFENTKAMLGGLLMPAVLEGVSVLSEYLGRFARIVDTFTDKGGGIANFKAGLMGLVTDIAADIATSLPEMLTTGLMILQTIIEGIIQSLPVILPAVIEMLLSLTDFIVQNLPMIVDAALQIVTALTNGLAGAAPTLVPAIVLLIGEILKVLVENGPALLDAGAQLIVGIAQGLVNAVPAEAKAAIEAFLTELGLNIALIAIALKDNSGATLVGALKDGFISNLFIMIGLSTPVGTAITNAITGAIKTVKKAGKSIVEGLWDGILGEESWLVKKVTEFVNGVIDAILEALGNPKSPAPATIPAGRYAVMGFEKGMTDEFRDMNKRMAAAFGNLAFSPAFASGGGSSGANYDYSTNSSISIGGIQIPGAGPGTTIADIMEFLNRRG